jgi:serine-protein kinase ATM
MGICGVDGVFRKTCEKTLEILRQNEKTLSTILEVLLYDPLYTWSLTTTQARNRQLEDESRNIVVVEEETDQNEDEKDSMASRALQKVQSKLKGQTDNSSGFSSVEGQVSLLIQQATDPNLLCRLFRGWMACL